MTAYASAAMTRPRGVEPESRFGLLELDVDHPRPKGFQMGDRLAGPGLDLGVAVFPEHRARHAEGEAGDAVPESRSSRRAGLGRGWWRRRGPGPALAS